MPVPMIHSLAQKSGKSDAEVEAKWNQAKQQVAKEYPDIGKDDDRHWALVASITKKMVGIKETVMANKNLKDLHPSAFHIDSDSKSAFYDHPDAFVKDATAAGANVVDHGNGVHSANIDGTEIGKYHTSPVAGMANGYGKLSIPTGAAPSASGNDDLMYMSMGDTAVASGPDADALGAMGEAVEAPASTGSNPKPAGVPANPAGEAPKDEDSDEVADRPEDAGGLAPHVHNSMEIIDFLTLVKEELAAVGDTAVVMQPFSHADYFEMIGDLTAADPQEVASSWNEAAEQIAQSHPDVSPDSDEFQALVAMEVLGTFDDLGGNDEDEDAGENDDNDAVGTDVDNADADAEGAVTEAHPGAHLSAKERSKIAKKARKGKKVGHGGFKKVAAKAAKEYGSAEAGRRVAAAAMWKHAHEGVEISEDMIIESMSKKDYVPIAAALKSAKDNGHPAHKQLVNDMADIMQKDNPNFDRERFNKAAGLNEGVYTKGAVGAAAGGAIGAAAGAAAGPAGAVVGGVTGAAYGAAIGVVADAIAALHKHEAAEKDPAKQAKIRAEIAKKQAHLNALKAKEAAHKAAQKNEAADGLSGYIAFYNGKKAEIHAASLYAAKQKAIEVLKVPKAKTGLLAVELAERPDGSQVTTMAEAVEAPAVATSDPKPGDVADDTAPEAPKLVALGNLPQYKNGALVLAPHVQEGIFSGPSEEDNEAGEDEVDNEEDKNATQMNTIGKSATTEAYEAPAVAQSAPAPDGKPEEHDDFAPIAHKDEDNDFPEYKNGVLVKAPAVTEADKWSGEVTKDVTSHPKDNLYATGSAKDIATAEKAREGSAGAAIKAIAFYKNRAGDKLSADRKAACDNAIAILQKQNEGYIPEAVSAKQKAKTAKIHDAIKRLTALRIQRVNAIKAHTPHAELTAAINVQKARIKALRA